MAFLARIAETLRFLRYGPTRVRSQEERTQAMVEDYDRRHAALEGVIRTLAERLAQAEARLAADASAAAVAGAELKRTREDVMRDFDSLRSQLSGLRAAVDRVGTSESTHDSGLAPSAVAAQEAFYPVLERHFRGPEALVKERLATYREWVERMPSGRVADLGCGRGEWLELLRDWGRDAVGVDSNPLVAQELRTRGLAIEERDALAWLQGQGDGTLAGVTAFQVVEHLPFGVLLGLLHEAERVLAPGGIVILETPNPENLDVATRTFWLDPSHVRPIPPELLTLAVQHCGLRELALVRVNPPDDGAGAGRDYALVATKARG